MFSIFLQYFRLLLKSTFFDTFKNFFVVEENIICVLSLSPLSKGQLFAIIYFFYLFIYAGTSGLAIKIVFTESCKKQINRYKENQYSTIQFAVKIVQIHLFLSKIAQFMKNKKYKHCASRANFWRENVSAARTFPPFSLSAEISFSILLLFFMEFRYRAYLKVTIT